MNIGKDDIVSGTLHIGVDPASPGGDLSAIVMMEKLPGGRYEVVGSMEAKSWDADVVRAWLVDRERRELEHSLRARKVSEAIIERILRLNLEPRPGERLRGLHYKDGWFWGLPRGLIQKGAVLRRYGYEAWERIPRASWVKNGRRVWVPFWAVEDAAAQKGTGRLLAGELRDALRR